MKISHHILCGLILLTSIQPFVSEHAHAVMGIIGHHYRCGKCGQVEFGGCAIDPSYCQTEAKKAEKKAALDKIKELYNRFKADGQKSHFTRIERIVSRDPAEGIAILDTIFRGEDHLRSKALLSLVIVVIKSDHAGARAFLIEHGWSNRDIDRFVQKHVSSTTSGIIGGISTLFRPSAGEQLDEIFDLYSADSILKR